jgi:hypothetical protein
VHETFDEETQSILDAADRAIARSQELVEQRRSIVAECERRRQQRNRELLVAEVRSACEKPRGE